jgi:protein-S-isoprenylcysteine O-methyltransferase Ste14
MVPSPDFKCVRSTGSRADTVDGIFQKAQPELAAKNRESILEDFTAASAFSSVVVYFTVGSGTLSCTGFPMPRVLTPLLKTLLFTVLVPGFVAGYFPYVLLAGEPAPTHGPLAWFGVFSLVIGACIYLATAWEFAVRGLGTPAPIAPTKFLVASGLHRHVRNPMYLGVALIILGQAALFHAPRLVVYAGVMLLSAHVFVILYEEPTLRRQFGEAYEEYCRTVPRWVPRFGK